MRSASSHRELEVWQVGRSLVRSTYALTRRLPEEERYVLVPQMRRAVNSVPANIAEGCGHGALRDYLRFLHIARGSLGETDAYVYLLEDLGYCKDRDVAPTRELVDRVGQMVNALMRSLRRSG